MIANSLKKVAFKTSYFIAALIIALSTVISTEIFSTQSVHAAVGSVSLYNTPYYQTYPDYLTLGSDNNIWYSGYSYVGKVMPSGTVNQYLQSGYNNGIVTGSDGNLWLAKYNSSTSTGSIVKMTTSNAVLAIYPLPSGAQPVKMILGPDGNVWFTYGGNGLSVGKITASGTITRFYIPYQTVSGGANLTDISSGPDGNVWFGINGGATKSAVGKIDSFGTVATYPVNTIPRGVASGPDGNIWYGTYGPTILKVTPSGAITPYSTGAGTSSFDIASGGDGAMWFTNQSSGSIGRITTDGIVSSYPVVGISPGNLGQIVAGTGDSMWFTTGGNNKIGKISISLSPQTITFESPAPDAAIVGGKKYAPVVTSNSGLPVNVTVDAASSGVCSIDGASIVSFQSSGTCTLNANQAGNQDYGPATEAHQSFYVLPLQADTSVALNCASSVNKDDEIECLLSVTNNGPANADDLSIVVAFSKYFENPAVDSDGVIVGQEIIWRLPSLASGDSIELSFSALAKTVGKASVSASVLHANPDMNIANNVTESIITID